MHGCGRAELINSFGVALLILILGLTIIPFQEEHEPQFVKETFPCAPHVIARTLETCIPFIGQSVLALALFSTAVLVARNFGWRAYRKFGATARGHALKRMYRKVFAASRPWIPLSTSPS